MSGYRQTCACGAIPFDPETGLCATCWDELPRGPFTCMRCCAGTSNDDDVCDYCRRVDGDGLLNDGGPRP